MVEFSVSRREATFIANIAARAVSLCREQGSTLDYQDVEMDLTACHCNGCRLDLQAMASGRDLDVIHDVLSIQRHLNRRTGKLEGKFDPRFALPVPAAKG